MIKKKILLVLGAGASRPFGFPTAAELKGLILGDPDMGKFAAEYLGYDDYPPMDANLRFGNWLRNHLAELGIRAASIDLFKSHFRDSNFLSIDRFLGLHEQYDTIGRSLIAATLLRCEWRAKRQGDWYDFIWNLISQMPDPARFISIITFNYDRSLQRFLVNSYHRGFGLNMSEAIGAVEKIPILPVYGNLGGLNDTNSDGVWTPWPESDMLSKAIYDAAKALKLVRAGAKSVHYNTFRRIGREAERILFLGFGFDPNNLQAIGLQPSYKSVASASSRGLDRINQQTAEDMLGHSIHFEDCTALEFLKRTPYLYS